MSGKKARIPESKLIKAIAELEGVAKGDPLEEADPEGGLSTEGEPLSDAAPSGRGEKTKKSRDRSASASSPTVSKASSSAASSSDDDDDDADDDDSDAASAMSSKPRKPFKKSDDKKKKKDAVKKMAYSVSASDEDDEDDDDDADKSFREMAEGDETVRKGIIVNDFLEGLVDQLSLALHNFQKSISKSLGSLEERINARIDNRVAKSIGAQQSFNVRLAKAVAAIGTVVEGDLLGMVDMVKSLADQPATAPRGKAVLSKGEVNQPPWSGAAGVNADQRMANGSDGDYIEELKELPPEMIGDWLFKKSANNQIDPKLILAWEADRYAVEALPMQVRKALATDLIK